MKRLESSKMFVNHINSYTYMNYKNQCWLQQTNIFKQ
jgi:hypothetical protein